MIKENFYLGDDLHTLCTCQESLKGVYERLIENGLSKNVYIVQQLEEIISKLEKLTK